MDWIQVLIAGAGGGAGGAIAMGIKRCISKVDSRMYRIMLYIVAVFFFAIVGILGAVFFPGNERIAALFRGLMIGVVVLLLPAKKCLQDNIPSNTHKPEAKPDNKEEYLYDVSTSEIMAPAAKPKNELKHILSTLKLCLTNTYGCFKVDIDPRTMQPACPIKNLYYFVDGVIGVNDTHFIFSHWRNDSQSSDTLRVEKELGDISNMKLHTYDKSKDETEEKVRYLVPGMFKQWTEVGYFWLPGGRSTEMICTICFSDGSEYYFYFRNNPNNIENINKIREYVMTKRGQNTPKAHSPRVICPLMKNCLSPTSSRKPIHHKAP